MVERAYAALRQQGLGRCGQQGRPSWSHHAGGGSSATTVSASTSTSPTQRGEDSGQDGLVVPTPARNHPEPGRAGAHPRARLHRRPLRGRMLPLVPQDSRRPPTKHEPEGNGGPSVAMSRSNLHRSGLPTHRAPHREPLNALNSAMVGRSSSPSSRLSVTAPTAVRIADDPTRYAVLIAGERSCPTR